MTASRNESPTIPPGFDVARYARDSDERIARVKSSAADADAAMPPETMRSEVRLLTRPEMGATMTDEAWARTMVGSPMCKVDSLELRKLPIDNRAAYVISLMDGAMKLDTLVDVACLPRDEVLRTVRDLYESDIVDFV
jgi:hypothetical protein